jgi:hypothetical protein
MTGDNITVVASDQSGSEWCDLIINLQTVANQVDDLATTLATILASADEIQTDLADGGRLDLILDAILASTDELQTDWVDGGRLDLILDSVATGGISAQAIRDALKLAPSAGSPDAGSIDEHLDNILASADETQTDLADGGRLDLILDAILADTGELQTDWVNGGRLDLILDAILADTGELQADWTNGGRLDNILDAVSPPSAAAIIDNLMARSLGGETYDNIIEELHAVIKGDMDANDSEAPTSVTYKNASGSVAVTHTLTSTSRANS